MRVQNQNSSGVNWQGQFYAADKDGVVDVPSEAMKDLAFLGWKAYTPVPKGPGRPKKQ